MKSIVKPIKRGRITKSALATVILTGALAVTASGCTAEIKMADGTPVGTVVINDEALASGISINQQGVNADVITDPAIQLPADDFDTDITPSVSVPEEARSYRTYCSRDNSSSYQGTGDSNSRTGKRQ